MLSYKNDNMGKKKLQVKEKIHHLFQPEKKRYKRKDLK